MIVTRARHQSIVIELRSECDRYITENRELKQHIALLKEELSAYRQQKECEAKLNNLMTQENRNIKQGLADIQGNMAPYPKMLPKPLSGLVSPSRRVTV